MAVEVSPLWRWCVTDLEGTTITFLDKLASNRRVTPKLNEALEVSGDVPSDNPEINILHTDGFPFLAEGVRQLYGLRREHNDPFGSGDPYYTLRFATLILQVGDAAASDNARTRFTAWDPWQYMMFRPVMDPDTLEPIRAKGYIYDSSWSADQIVFDIFQNSFLASDPTQPPAARDNFVDWAGGSYETCDTIPSPGFKIEQGTSIGKALQDLCEAGYMDIWMEPIWEYAYPTPLPGYLGRVHVYKETSTQTGQGSLNYSAIFSWDSPYRSASPMVPSSSNRGGTTVGMDNLYDGTQRANKVQFFNGQGGTPVPTVEDLPSIRRYGEYWAQQFFPAHTFKIPVLAIASEQLSLRSNFKQTLTVNPAPERSPEPWVDYFLGDIVPIYASDRLRQPIPPKGVDYVFQRIYGIPVEIDDNGVETVRELLTGPLGIPPPIGNKVRAAGSITGLDVAVGKARRTNRAGTGQSFGGRS